MGVHLPVASRGLSHYGAHIAASVCRLSQNAPAHAAAAVALLGVVDGTTPSPRRQGYFLAGYLPCQLGGRAPACPYEIVCAQRSWAAGVVCPRQPPAAKCLPVPIR